MCYNYLTVKTLFYIYYVIFNSSYILSLKLVYFIIFFRDFNIKCIDKTKYRALYFLFIYIEKYLNNLLLDDSLRANNIIIPINANKLT